MTGANDTRFIAQPVVYKRQRIPKGQSKHGNPERLSTQGTQAKNTTQYVLDTTMRKQTQIM